MRKSLKDKKNETCEDLFVVETSVKDTKSSIPLIIVLSITAIITILAYVGWETAFALTWTTDALTWINEVEIFGHPIFSLLIATLILKAVYSISFDEILESFAEGFKKSGKLIVIMLLAYVVLEFSVMYPVLPTISNWILGLTDSFNVFTTYITGLILKIGMNLLGISMPDKM